MAYNVLISPRSDVTFDISLHEVCVRVGVRYVMTKFSRMNSLPNFLTHGAPQARFAHERAPLLAVDKVNEPRTLTPEERVHSL